MSDKKDEHLIEELNETIQKKDNRAPMEKPRVIFCSKQAKRSRGPESTKSNYKNGQCKRKKYL
ncbi:hypothetical protein E4G67_02965 [Candidatus Bathyarchaeota archaeon]|nr:MAG: hypothetical protein E4G67_02965 [Candidatus Bathyarchaeota archaeon]